MGAPGLEALLFQRARYPGTFQETHPQSKEPGGHKAVPLGDFREKRVAVRQRDMGSDEVVEEQG